MKAGGLYYAQAFPRMISSWREAFKSPRLPFVFVELDSAKQDFWLGQRNATTALSNVGFATTADIQRALHPADKQDIADRWVLGFVCSVAS